MIFFDNKRPKMDKHKVRWKFWHLFPFPLFKIRNTVDNGPSLSCFIIAPIQSTSFSPKNSQTWNLKLKLSRSGANIALHFVNPFIMRQPILIQFKMEKTNRALSPQRKSKKSHSGFNRPKNIIFYGFPRTVLCFNQIIHCHSFWKEKSQYRISAPNLFTASYQLKKF